MNGSDDMGSRERTRVLNAVPLQNSVLCAECDVVSDSPHDVCMVCGSHSLFNVARVFGGKLPKKRATLITGNRPKRHVKPYWSFPNLIGPGGGRWAHASSPPSRSTIIRLHWNMECWSDRKATNSSVSCTASNCLMCLSGSTGSNAYKIFLGYP
jgi:hypothetical protein